jgi:hypothetical protein
MSDPEEPTHCPNRNNCIWTVGAYVRPQQGCFLRVIGVVIELASIVN